MSRWGEGNFESDLAADYLISILYQLIDVIEMCLQQDEVDALLRGETQLMPSIAILITLSEAYPDVSIPVLEKCPIEQWRIAYLQIFDKQSEVSMDTEFKERRRQVIQQTFDWATAAWRN